MESEMFFFFVPSDEANETCEDLKGAKKRVSAYCNKYMFFRSRRLEDFLILYSNRFWTGPNQSRMLSVDGVERYDTKKPTALCMVSIPSNIEGLFEAALFGEGFLWANHLRLLILKIA